MPTPRKNRPSRIPRNGSMSASIWWRNTDSESSTPARNAPIAIESPPSCISSAAPSTTSSAAAVITSRARAAASSRNSGFSRNTPATTSTASEATPIPIAPQREAAPASGGNGDMNATSASSGTISRSSNSRIDTIFCPRGEATSPRSPSSCITIAVEVITNPAPATNATGQFQPSRRPAQVSSTAHVAICSVPRPKICRRRFHRCEGRISSPITNRNITTPSSATCRIDCGLANQPKPNGPISRPAAR